MFSDGDREQFIEIMTAAQVAEGSLYNTLLEQSPLLAKFMMDKFKAFLNDSCITDIERQTLLMKFLTCHTDYETVDSVLRFIEDSCDLKTDYVQILMEWTYHNSEEIISRSLDKFDGAELLQQVNKDNYFVLPKKTIPEKIKKLKRLSLGKGNKELTLEDINTFLEIILQDIPDGPVTIEDINTEDTKDTGINNSNIDIENSSKEPNKKKRKRKRNNFGEDDGEA